MALKVNDTEATGEAMMRMIALIEMLLRHMGSSKAAFAEINPPEWDGMLYHLQDGYAEGVHVEIGTGGHGCCTTFKLYRPGEEVPSGYNPAPLRIQLDHYEPASGEVVSDILVELA